VFKHAFRISALFVPSLVAWMVALYNFHRDELTRAVSQALGPVWIVLFALVVLRWMSLMVARRKEPQLDVAARLDVLTSSGCALSWFSAAAIIGAVKLGWASLGAVGVLGTAIFHLCAIYAFLALREVNPFARGSIKRSLVPASVTEGDEVKEEIALTDVRIPVGYRLFISGQVGPRWATSRHVLDAAESEAELVLESEIGPAVRGEHDAPPLEMWFEDTFGITKSAPFQIAPAKVTVLPKQRPIDKSVTPLLQQGIGPRAGKAARRIPTEGVMDMREYRDGDDVRRIHWVRSLAAGQLIVRLPDEIPPDRPKVRLVLDTFFPEAFIGNVEAATEVLDAMVAVWLGVARALAEKGIQVTLVSAAPHDGHIVVKRFDYASRWDATARQLGAMVQWQSTLQPQQMFSDEATFVISHGVHIYPPADPKFHWIILQLSADQLTVPAWQLPGSGRTPFPLGHPENRWGHRTKLVREIVEARRDYDNAMRAMNTNIAPPPPGSFIARPYKGEIILERVAS
jgi:uncharacterized protein (DUF58 family)